MKYFIFCGLILIYIQTAFADDSHDEIKMLRDEDVIVSLESLIKKAQQLKSGRVIEVELERENGRYVYEIEILDHQRQVWEFYFDAQNGQLLKQGIED